MRDTVFAMGSEANALWAPFDPLSYKGWEVVEIDNVPAIEAITAFANTQIGVARDPNVRFNLVKLQNTAKMPPIMCTLTLDSDINFGSNIGFGQNDF